MKYFAFVALVTAFALAGWLAAHAQHRRQKAHSIERSAISEHIDAQRIAALIKSTDRIVSRVETKNASQEITVFDQARIQRIAEIISTTAFGPKEHCLCSGWRTAHFYRADQELLRIAAIHGNQLRLYWSDGGGDFAVSKSDWNAMHTTLTMLQAP